MEDRLGGTSELGLWLCRTTGATNPRKALADRCAELIAALGDRHPPTRVGPLGQLLGLEPGPRVRPQIPRGMLDLTSGQTYLRSFRPIRPEGSLDLETGVISVQDRADQFRPLTFGERARMRFTCAHEIGHALFYNFNTRPARRSAPLGPRLEEERFCDYAARHFLLPAAWIEPEFAAHHRPSLALLRACAARYIVSLRVAAARAAEWFAPRLAANDFYLLSRVTTNAAGGGVKKPRCLGVFLSNRLRSEGVSFLRGYQGLAGVKRVGVRVHDWSLNELHAGLCRKQPGLQSGPHVEILRCPDGSIVNLTSTHFRLGCTTTVWTEGRIEVVANPTRFRRAA